MQKKEDIVDTKGCVGLSRMGQMQSYKSDDVVKGCLYEVNLGMK
jgi:hypothetical protein